MADRPPPASPLAGRTILLARPEGQGEPLAVMLVAAGAMVLRFAAIRIEPPVDPGAARDALARLDRFDGAIFVSANAVRAAFAMLDRPWPAAVPALAVGPTTAEALRARGVACVLAPTDRFDSEGLLELPLLASPAGRTFLIVRGAGGREALREALQARGANVAIAEVYRRTAPAALPEDIGDAWRGGGIDAIVAHSAEAIANLLGCLDPDLRSRAVTTPMFVPHPRIARAARAAGLTNVHETTTGDGPMVKATQQFFATVER